MRRPVLLPALLPVLLPVLLSVALLLAGCGGRGGPIPDTNGTVTPGNADAADPDAGEVAPRFAEPGPGQVRHPLTGLPVATADLAGPYHMVVVGNNPQARPQSGLDAADLVYEIPAEGGITRFLALFRTGTADPIGPVRSSRSYILTLAREWEAVLVHVGGSPGHYEQVGKSGVRVFDDRGASGRGVFWREKGRRAPNNLYTNSPRLQQKLRQQGWGPPAADRRPFRFVLPAALPTGTAAAAVTVFWPGQTKAPLSFRYDPETYEYERYLGGVAHTDRERAEPLTATSLLIQFVPVRQIPGDSEGRLELDLVGKGSLLTITGGTRRRGTWEKPTADAPTAYYDAPGQPVTLLPGQVWILLVPEGTEVETN